MINPLIGEMISMLLFNGSDACVILGHSLTSVAVEQLVQCFEQWATTDVPKRTADDRGKQLDRAAIEHIILNFQKDLASCQACFEALPKLCCNHFLSRMGTAAWKMRSKSMGSEGKQPCNTASRTEQVVSRRRR